MSRQLTLDLPEEVDRALRAEAARRGKSPAQVAIEWIESRVAAPRRGSAEALMASHGTWSMTPQERIMIERMIEEERLLEDDEQ
ncbi:MAG: hypothetical protein WD069_14870 [Planctomycetales bacterium]